MGQKANPIANRLGIIKGWDSNWFGGNDYSSKLTEDNKIREYLITFGDTSLREFVALRVKGKKGRPDIKENRRQRDINQHRNPNRAFRRTFGRNRGIFLDIVLIRQKITQIFRDSVDYHHPNCSGR